MECPDLASNDQPALGISLNKANIPLEREVPVVSPLSVEEVGMGVPSGVVTAPTSSPEQETIADRVLVSTYVPPLERVYPPMDMVAPDLEDKLKIVHRCHPLNQEASPVTRIIIYISITSGCL